MILPREQAAEAAEAILVKVLENLELMVEEQEILQTQALEARERQTPEAVEAEEQLILDLADQEDQELLK